jgi:hypothetical protein
LVIDVLYGVEDFVRPFQDVGQVKRIIIIVMGVWGSGEEEFEVGKVEGLEVYLFGFFGGLGEWVLGGLGLVGEELL